MASGSTAMLRRAAQPSREHKESRDSSTTHCSSGQASAEHFQQCTEFPLLRNRSLGPLAVTVLPIPPASVLADPLSSQEVTTNSGLGHAGGS